MTRWNIYIRLKVKKHTTTSPWPRRGIHAPLTQSTSVHGALLSRYGGQSPM